MWCCLWPTSLRPWTGSNAVLVAGRLIPRCPGTERRARPPIPPPGGSPRQRRLRQEGWRAPGTTLAVPYWLALKAGALYLADRTSEALEAITEAEASAYFDPHRYS